MVDINVKNLIEIANNYLSGGYFDLDIRDLLNKYNDTGLDNSEINDVISYCAICQKEESNRDYAGLTVGRMKRSIMKMIGRYNSLDSGNNVTKPELMAIYKFIIELPKEVLKGEKDE